MNAAKNVMSSNYKNMELDEYLKETLEKQAMEELIFKRLLLEQE